MLTQFKETYIDLEQIDTVFVTRTEWNYILRIHFKSSRSMELPFNSIEAANTARNNLLQLINGETI